MFKTSAVIFTMHAHGLYVVTTCYLPCADHTCLDGINFIGINFISFSAALGRIKSAVYH